MRFFLLMLLIVVWLPGSAARAQDAEPQIYLFYSASCPYSQATRALLQSAQRRDRRLRIKEFEVDESAANMELLERAYEQIGMPDLPVVPLVVVGVYAIIGYADDPTTEAEILGAVEECRKQYCPDGLRPLIDSLRSLEEASAGETSDPPTCSTQKLGTLKPVLKATHSAR
jgi:glutaredoxin